MEPLLQIFILIPVLAFLVSLCLNRKNEKLISGMVITANVIQLAAIVLFIANWFFQGAPTLNSKHVTLFVTGDIEIFIDFFFDKVTMVFALTGSLLALIVSVFSRFYLHREPGFKRYFCTILLFLTGYNLVVFSGNFETLFIGWEIVGICSFLLIAFYRDRYLPVKNSMKVISLYRLGDICFILAMWMSHHLWHENITFLQLQDSSLVKAHLKEHNWYGFFIAAMITVAAIIKSAQFPFSSWLPRAMEGPTTSSAIFYGSLSVHLGAFLLLRTFPYWESIISIKVLIITIGAVTALVATGIAKVQSSVKTQIAYSSIAQIGLIFIEIALGLHVLALIHFAGNAFLRTYQLLVSPSVLGYLVHNQFFNFMPRLTGNRNTLSHKFKNTIYMLGIKEWNMDRLISRVFWSPFKWIGNKMSFLSSKMSVFLLFSMYLLGFLAEWFHDRVPGTYFDLLPFVFSFIGLLLILSAFAERGHAIKAWFQVVGGQLYIALSIVMLNENFGHNHMLLYLSGSVLSAFVGWICLKKIEAIDQDITLNRFHGYVYEQSNIGLIFLIACLGMIGLPFTPTFIGIDILFSHIHKHEEILIVFTSLSFVFIELAVLRIYARIFLGQHKKMHHPIAYRSS